MAVLPSSPLNLGGGPMELPSIATPPIASQGQSMFDRLRQSNIFNPPPQASGGYDPNMYMNQAGPQQMETPAYDALSGLLGERPEYEGPGMLKKIAASMMALNDPRLAMALLHQPDPALIDWQNQVGTAQKAAELEEKIQKTKSGTEAAGRRATTAEERLDFDREKFEAELTPADKQILELEKIDRRSENVLEQIESRAAAARETGDERHANTLEAIAERAREARVTAGTRGTEARETATHREEERKRLRPTAGGTSGAQSLERRRSIANRAQEHLARNPELEKFIEVDMSSGKVTIQQPDEGGWFSDSFTPQQRQDAIDAIFPSEVETAAETPKEDPLGIR